MSLVVSAVGRSSINFNDAKNVHTGRQFFQIVYSSLRDTEEGRRTTVFTGEKCDES